MRVRPGAAGGPAPPSSPPQKPPRPPPLDRPPTFHAVLGERATAAAGPPPVPPRPRAPPGPAGAPPAAVSRLLERTLEGERRLDTLLAAAARGKTFSPSELLALQASVFRYSQAVEVVSRATDKLVGAVKQALGTQV